MPSQRRTTKSATKTTATSSKSAAKDTRRSTAKSSSGAGRGSAHKTTSASRARRTPDALELLTEDHRTVQKMFRKAERLDAGDPQLQEIIRTACAALAEHAALEEQLFYPAVRAQADADDLLDEAEVEHDVAKDLIAQLQGAAGGDEHTKAMFKVLGEYVNHHIEEEEGELFRKAKRAKMDLAALGEQITAAKQGEQAADGAGESEDSQGGSGGRRRSGRSQDDAGESPRSRAGSDDDEGSSEGSRARSGRSRTEEVSDEEIDVETPGGRAAGNRSPSPPTSH